MSSTLRTEELAARPVRSSHALLVVALVFAEITAAFETTMVFTAMKQLFEEYQNTAAVGWVLSAYLLVGGAASAICGRLGDLFGRRAILLVALAAAGMGSMVSALAPTLAGVVVGRAIQGMSAATLPLELGIARERLPSAFLPTAVGLVTGTATIGGVLGMVVGGVIVDNYGWRYIFVASSVLAFISFIVCWIAIPRSTPVKNDKPIDIVGGLLFAPAVVGVLYAISAAHTWQLDWRFWSLLAVSAILIVLWIRHELRHRFPLIDVRLLARPGIALPNAALGFCALGAFQFSPLVLLLLQQPMWTGIGLGLSATVAAFVKVPGNLTAALFSPVSGFLCGRVGGPLVVAVGMGATAVACVAVALMPNHFVTIVLATVLAAVGTSATYIAVPNILLATAPKDRISETAGVSSVVRAISMAIGSQLMIAILASSRVADPEHAGSLPSAKAYVLTLAAIAVSCVFGAACGALSRRTGGKMTAQHAAHESA
ncbi:MAG: MFS transporter [Casimicrobiaceae bacterium]